MDFLTIQKGMQLRTFMKLILQFTLEFIGEFHKIFRIV